MLDEVRDLPGIAGEILRDIGGSMRARPVGSGSVKSCQRSGAG
jgi:hypothetical protein